MLQAASIGAVRRHSLGVIGLRKYQRGFSLVELVTIMVIVGVLAAVSVSRIMPNSVMQVQAARDLVVSSLSVAQQQALAQTMPVRVLISSTSIDVRRDGNQDGSFTADESIRFAGVQYPQVLAGNITVSNTTLDYDRLGRTSSATVTLSKSGVSVDVVVSEAGYAR